MKLNVHVFFTPFTNESRALKQGYSLIESGTVDQVVYLAAHSEGLLFEEEFEKNISVVRLPIITRRLPKNIFVQLVKYIEWCLRIWLVMVLHRKELHSVQAHSLSALFPAVIAKFIFRTPLVYDAHELETETSGLMGIRKSLAKVAEWMLIRFVNETVVVNESIAMWYQQKYKMLKPVAVRNVPVKRCVEISSDYILREEYGISDDSILFIYTGFFSPRRGIERLLNVFASLNDDKCIVFMGKGDLKDTINRFAEKNSNIFLHDPVKPNEVVNYVSGADVAVSLFENTCLSHYYVLPNKLFEGVLAGVPVLCTDLPEMANLISGSNAGWLASFDDAELMRQIENLTMDDLLEKKKGVLSLRERLSWSDEAEKFIAVYGALEV